MDAVVWVQTSTEYAAVTTSIYAGATAALDDLETSGHAEQFAVVLDVDETVLDNSAYQGQLVLDDTRYASDTWDQWIEDRAAPAVPGVVEFIQAAQSRGIHVAFITNRACRPRANTAADCPQKEDTLNNLADIGIDAASTTLYLRGERPPEQCRTLLTAEEQPDGTWSSDKTSRRACVALDRNIAMFFGDQLGDFTAEPEVQPDRDGRQTTGEFSEYWGKTWFMLPNPTYGDWLPRTHSEKRSLIRGVE